MTAVTGAGIMLISGDVPVGSLCAVDDVSALIEELQYTVGEGPCMDAYRLDRPVLEPDLADPAERRWMAFTGPALDAGVRAIFGFPIGLGSARLGALNLHMTGPGPSPMTRTATLWSWPRSPPRRCWPCRRKAP